MSGRYDSQVARNEFFFISVIHPDTQLARNHINASFLFHIVVIITSDRSFCFCMNYTKTTHYNRNYQNNNLGSTSLRNSLLRECYSCGLIFFMTRATNMLTSVAPWHNTFPTRIIFAGSMIYIASNIVLNFAFYAGFFSGGANFHNFYLICLIYNNKHRPYYNFNKKSFFVN